VLDEAPVTVVTGSYLTADEEGVRLRHVWTSSGVGVRTDFTGAHLLHLAVAGCVLNDTYREAAALNIEIVGVRVSASGGSTHAHGNPLAFSMYSRSTRQLRHGTSSNYDHVWSKSRRFPKRFDWAVRVNIQVRLCGAFAFVAWCDCLRADFTWWRGMGGIQGFPVSASRRAVKTPMPCLAAAVKP
jgi:hypothetical protein